MLDIHRPLLRPLALVLSLAATCGFAFVPGAAATCELDAQLEAVCPNVITADVVALDQPYFFNRLGASQPNGQIFALRSDVVCVPGTSCEDDQLTIGNVMLRSDKRPRPMVLRVAEGDCLRIELENLLAPLSSSNSADFEEEYGLNAPIKTITRAVGIHVMGLSLVAACDGDEVAPPIDADASYVGSNENSLAKIGEKRTYVYQADQEGGYLLHSTGAMAGLINGNGQVALGLHGMVNVEPPGAVFFRSQVTRQDLLAANRRDDCPFELTSTDEGDLCLTPHGQPLIDYWAQDEDGRPILAMLAPGDDGYELTSTDLTALIAYQEPGAGPARTGLAKTEPPEQPGAFPYDPEDPLCFPVPAATGNAPPETRCTRPFREITTIYQEPLPSPVQALSCLTQEGQDTSGQKGSWDTAGNITTITLPADGTDSDTVGLITASQTQCPEDWNITPYLMDVFAPNASVDSFAINFGIDAIGPRVLANRVRIGPQADCVGCKYEEFFLSSWPNGDPAQVSTRPPGLGPYELEQGELPEEPEAIRFPDDPSNVYHSYMGDPVKYRIASAGSAAAHVHHQHAHQWLHTPNASSSHYLDSQTITPGSTYTLEMVYSGSGNRNETVGDAIFHCHFYPHFASGMWALWRVHDVYETGTRMDDSTGLPESSWQCVQNGEVVDDRECRREEPDAEDDEGEKARWRLTTPNRALPDPTIAAGTPIPAIVPLPTRAMPPMPATVALSPDGKRGLTLIRKESSDAGSGDAAASAEGDHAEASWQVLGGEPSLTASLDSSIEVLANDRAMTARRAAEIGNPGFPFFIPGLAGQRAVRPPLDVPEMEISESGETTKLDGGLPRHRIGARQQVAKVSDQDAVDLAGSTPPTVDGCTPQAEGNTYRECHTRHDFTKILLDVDAEELDDEGEPAERLAMLWHGELFPGGQIPSCDSEGICGKETTFRLNGSPAISGAPFADPCTREDHWNGETRRYKAAAIQTDVVFTKEGWHFPQQRMLSLWQDVEPTLAGKRTPEPLFFRANSGECIDFWHSNLVPSVYALDDYQVRTPTDIIGQHIHLVKFDVTSSDGAANGFNYEDATFSPDEVRERISAINAGGGLHVGQGALCPDGKPADANGRCQLEARALPFFGPGPGGSWLGAMATVQRWMADPLEDVYGDDRTLRTVFTHDHMSPSTHQQAGLYAGLLVEPECSQWVDSWTGEIMGGSLDPLAANCHEAYAARPFDGGPTSWRSNILLPDPDPESGGLIGVREFALEFQDLALAYPREVRFPPDSLALQELCPSCPGPAKGVGNAPSSIANKFNFGADFPRPVNTPGISAPTPPWPQAVTFGAMFGIYSVNYRSEPLFPRIFGSDGSPPPADGLLPANRDMAQVYRSIERENPRLNTQPDWYPPLTGGVQGTDPYTPLLEAYAGDRVQIRTLTGAHFLNHQFNLRGLPWLFEPSLANSGYRAAQSTSLSEHFEMNILLPKKLSSASVDFLYQTDITDQGQSKGAWGLLRAYEEAQSFLAPLPDNPPLSSGHGKDAEPEAPAGRSICSPDSLDGRNGFELRRYRVLALAASSFTNDTKLPYFSPLELELQATDSDGTSTVTTHKAAVESPEGLVYVLAEDVEHTRGGWAFKAGRQHEPLVLRAAAGDCLEVTLENHFDPRATAFVTANPTDEPLMAPRLGSSQCTDAIYLERLAQVESGEDPSALDGFGELCAGSFAASSRVGLSPQLVAYDPAAGAGYDAGFNPVQTVAARHDGSREGATSKAPSRTYFWYAGHVETDDRGGQIHTPVEFGAANLFPADPLFQATKGLFGALVIEPQGARWVTDANTRLQATVYPVDDDPFREGVLLFQDALEVYLRIFQNEDGDEGGDGDESSADGEESTAYGYQALNVQNLANFSGQTSAVGYGVASPLLSTSPPMPFDVAATASSSSTGEEEAPQAFGSVFFTDLAVQTCWFSSAQTAQDPATTMLAAHAGTPYRLRLLHPLGNFTPQTFVLHGHGWQEEPYAPLEGRANDGGYLGPEAVSQTIGDNPYSQWMGSQGGFGPGQHFDAVLAPVQDGEGGSRHNGAGGRHAVPGDYLYRTWQSNGFTGGAWGLFRVGPRAEPEQRRDIVRLLQVLLQDDGTGLITGTNTSILGSQPGEQRFAQTMTLYAGDGEVEGCQGEPLATFKLDDPTGPIQNWTWQGDVQGADSICVRSDAGGFDAAPVLEALPCPPLGTKLQAAIESILESAGTSSELEAASRGAY